MQNRLVRLSVRIRTLVLLFALCSQQLEWLSLGDLFRPDNRDRRWEGLESRGHIRTGESGT